MNNMRKLMETVKQLDEDDKNFNKHGFRTVFERLPITGVEGNIYKVTAVDYDASVTTNMAEIDGVMIGWYEHERDETVYIHIRDLEKILDTVKSKL